MPAIIARSILILSDAGLGMAMFSLGLFMALQLRIIACGNKLAAFAMAVRFLSAVYCFLPSDVLQLSWKCICYVFIRSEGTIQFLRKHP